MSSPTHQGPGITVGDNPSADASLVERNFVLSVTDIGIGYGASSIVRNNIVEKTTGAGIERTGGATMSDVIIANNTVIVEGTALSIREPGDSVSVYNNELIGTTMAQQESGTGTPDAGNNIGVGALVGVSTGYDNSASALALVGATPEGSLSVYPIAGSPAIGAGDAAHQPTDDFNGTDRDGTHDVGAYVYAASGNPGWALAAGFKPATPTPGDQDVGSGDSDLPDGASGGDGDDVVPTDSDNGQGGGDTLSTPDSGDNGSNGGTGSKSGCAAVQGSLFVSLLTATAMLARRRGGVPER